MPTGFTPRTEWPDAPRPLVRAVERALATTVVGIEAVHGGMSPGPAAVLSLDDGRQVFAKAVAAQQSAKAHALYAREAEVLPRLPADVPHARLVTHVVRDDWIVIVTDAASGAAVGPPWRSQHVAATTDAVAVLSAHTDVDGLAPAVDRLPTLDGWELLAERPDAGNVLDGWERDRIHTLVAMSRGWRTWTAGSHAVHLDVRCDNVVEHDDGVWLVDWAHAASGAKWLDAACLAADVVACGHVGGEAVALRAATGILAGLPFEAKRFVVAMTGMFRHNSLREPVSTAPTLRAWQADRARSLRPLVETLVTR
ncbi:hypothetical protein [Terrabacter sp. 2RAF25]|uniref:hypothetical protein n=1 Tax=Terrabacter sp. 2RAF25 TaxID=3232998 RepID=UPI003F9612D8